MYQQKDYIFSETLGVCRVDDVTKLSLNKGKVMLYYVLRPVNDRDKVAYIPVENHSVVLRDLVSPVEATYRKENDYDELSILLKQEIDFVLKTKDNEK